MKWEKKSLLIFIIFILAFLVYEYQGQNDLKRKKKTRGKMITHGLKGLSEKRLATNRKSTREVILYSIKHYFYLYWNIK